MTASTMRCRGASFAFDQPLLSNGRHFSTADYHVARRYIDRTLARGSSTSRCQAPASSGSTTCGRRGSARRCFSLVKVDSVSGYDIEMMDDPDLVLLHE